MATTLTALVVDGSRAHVAHVGDSRLYLIRNRRVLQKTKDHTVAAGRQRIGLLDAAGAKEHPGRSVLTRSVGKDLIAQVDRITFSIEAGDVLVLCSDGLYNVLPDDELKEAVLDKEPTSACAAIIRAANTRGTPDNLTVAVVQVVGGPGPSERSGWRGFFAKVLGH
jgi:protein phosphatase